MSEGQSRRSVASSVQHRQEAEVVAAEERERAAAETAATTARAARLAMTELAAARAEVEAAAAADAARAAVTELKAALFLPIMTETTSSSWKGRQRGSRRRSGQLRTPRGAVVASLTGADAPTVLRAEARVAAVSPTAAAAQTGADMPTAGLTEIAAFTCGVALSPRTGIMVTMGSRPLSGTSVPAAGGLTSPRPTTSSGPR
jgi:hypothetical protein